MLYFSGKQESPAGRFAWSESGHFSQKEYKETGHVAIRIDLLTSVWVNQQLTEAEARVEVIRGLDAGGDSDWITPADGDWLIKAGALPESLRKDGSLPNFRWFDAIYRVRPSYRTIEVFEDQMRSELAPRRLGCSGRIRSQNEEFQARGHMPVHINGIPGRLVSGAGRLD
jgi:hypothetical protein